MGRVIWFVLWIVGALAAPLGFLMLALPSSSDAAAAAAHPTPFTPAAPYALMLVGSVLSVVGIIGVWRSGPRHPAGLRQMAHPVAVAGPTASVKGVRTSSNHRQRDWLGREDSNIGSPDPKKRYAAARIRLQYKHIWRAASKSPDCVKSPDTLSYRVS